MLAYSGYRSGFLPTEGAMGSQNALFPELMYWTETWLTRYGMIARGEDPDSSNVDKKSFLEDEGIFVSSS